MTAAQLDAAVTGAASLLLAYLAAPERLCPRCRTPMAPLRVGATSACVERCETCDCSWVEPADLRTLQMLLKSSARSAAWSSLPAHEREAMAGDLANAVQSEERPASISAGEAVLAFVGMPVLQKVQGTNAPVLTWALCAAMALTQLLKVHWALVAGSGEWLKALSAPLAHAGWLELVFTAMFFLVFGSSAERVLPRWLFAALLLVSGPGLAVAQSLVAANGAVIGSASPWVAACAGVCLAVQRRARVVVFGFRFFTIPLWLYGAAWVLFQILWFSFSIDEAAWVPRLFGFTTGLIAGIFAQRRFVPR